MNNNKAEQNIVSDETQAVVDRTEIESAKGEGLQPLAVVPAEIELSALEQPVMTRLMRYTRKGAMKPREVTRQVWVEDFLTRGFTVLDLKRFGRAPSRLRISNPNTGKFYEVQSAIEIAYVQKRHKALFQQKPIANAEPTMAPPAPPAVVLPPQLPKADPNAGAQWSNDLDEILKPDAAQKISRVQERRPTATVAPNVKALAEAVTTDEMPIANAIRFAQKFYSSIEARDVGPLLAVFARADVGNAAWSAFHQIIGTEGLPSKTNVVATDTVRAWAGEDSWRRYLAERQQRAELTAAALKTETQQKPGGADFSYGRDEELTPRGRKTRISANLAAIELLKNLEKEDRPATDDEKRVLAVYNGWGADKELFNSGRLKMMVETYPEWYGKETWRDRVSQSAKQEQQRGYTTGPYSEFMSWMDEYGTSALRLRELLTKEEWNAAAASILNAHYTEEKTCHFLWDMVKRAGFLGGKVVEPAVGSGRILGAMPADLKALSRTEAVELDSISARITAKLFPQTRVHQCGFEEAAIAPASMDLVITNVPFSENGPGVQEGLGGVDFNLHNYFIAESMRKLKPGGIAVIITSASTLQNNDEQRKALAKQAELWAAVRLPSDAFKNNAGTDVVTDVLLLRKPDGIMRTEAESWTQVHPVRLGEEGVFVTPKGERRETTLINEYFAGNPEMVLGEHSLKGKMYGRDENRGQYTVISKGEVSIEDQLAKVLEKMPANIPNSTNRARSLGSDASRAVNDGEKLMAISEEKVGSLVLREGRLLQVSNTRELDTPTWLQSEELPVGIRSLNDGLALGTSYVRLRDSLQKLITTDLSKLATDEQSAQRRSFLREEYARFVKQFGTLAANAKRLRNLATQDPDIGSVLALETVKETREGKTKKQVVSPATILHTRTLFPPATVTKANSLEDALVVSLNETGGVDALAIADLLGKSDVENVEKALCEAGLAFPEPGGGKLVHRNTYLAGDVLTKLELARKASEADPRFLLNVKALEAVAPARVPWEHIQVQFGATWVPPHIVNRFVKEAIGAPVRDGAGIFYAPSACSWFWPTPPASYSSLEAKWGTSRMEWSAILMSALNQQPIAIYDRLKEGGSVYNPIDSGAATARAEAMILEWKSWLNRQPDLQAELTERYNATFNRCAPVLYTGEYLSFPGLASGPNALVPRGHQRRGTERGLAEQSGVVAHGVGFGKTMTGILVGHESRRMRLARKPLTVCDGANYAQFVETHRKLYPQDRILVADDVNFNPAERENFKAQVAYGDWDGIYMSRTQFERIPVSSETEMRWLNEEIDELRATFDLMEENGQGKKARQIQKAIESRSEKLTAIVEEKKIKADRGLTWEQLGVDLLIVDEAHRHKKCGFATAHLDIKGIDPTASARGRDLLMKGRFIQERRDGKGMIGLTGTPCTNTMAEYWNMIRLFQPKTLEMFGVENFDSFKTAFCVTQTAMEMNEANGKWRNVQRLSKFINGPSLVRFLRTGMDVEMDSAKLGLKVPKHVSGQIELSMVPITDTVLSKMDELASIYQAYEDSANKKELSWVPIVLMQMGMAASIDPRLFDRTAPDEEFSLVNEVVRNVVKIHQQTDKDRLTQVVFCDRYNTMNTSILSRLKDSKSDLGSVKLVVDEDRGAESEEEAEEAAAPAKVVKESGGWDLYADMKQKLVAQGMKPEEIVIISEAKNAKERGEMFERVNRGEVLVIIGSSDKLGIGANFQQRLYAAHHVDPARNMTPDQMEQRNGRILRQGNTNEEVRVIYYGMQDTVTPAVYHRIQRKSEFIKQGLAERGVGLEFEDTGEIRLEEMKAALITDKRQLQRAELIAAIRDERMNEEVAANRVKNVAQTRSSLEWTIDYCQAKEMPIAARREEWFTKWVSEPKEDGKLTIDVSALTSGIVINEAKEALDAWLEKNGPVITGEYADVAKKLKEVVDLQKEVKRPLSNMSQPLGTILINGLAMKLSKEEVTFKSSGREAEALILRVSDPSALGEELVSATNYGTAEALIRTVMATSRNVRETPRGLELKRQRTSAELAKVKEEEARLTNYDTTKMTTLKAELVKLEQDMRDNPYVRGANKRTAAVAPVSSVEVIEQSEDLLPSKQASKAKVLA